MSLPLRIAEHTTGTTPPRRSAAIDPSKLIQQRLHLIWRIGTEIQVLANHRVTEAKLGRVQGLASEIFNREAQFIVQSGYSAPALATV